MPRSELALRPGFLVTETPSLDSGSLRHIAYTRLQPFWARSLSPNWRRISPEPGWASGSVVDWWVSLLPRPLIVLMAMSIGILELLMAQTLRRQGNAAGAWPFGLAGV